MPQTLWIFIAVLIVLALIGAVAWLVRRFGGNSIGSSGARGRMPRLAVIDAAAVDGRRRLVLVRRDNVEHLLMIGGPSDLVVEPNIVRTAAQRDQAPQRQPVGTELPPRVALPDTSWPEPATSRTETFDFPDPVAPPERPVRSSFSEDTRRPAAPPLAAERPHSEEAGDLVPEPIVRPESLPRSERPRPPLPRSEPRLEPSMPRMPRSADLPPRSPAPPPLRPAARAPEPSTSAADQNLAEMAQRLEAALRRPGGARAEVTETRTTVSVSPAERVGAPPVAPEAPAPRVAEAPAAAPTFDNLEDEMASLLGRPKNST
jgi:flagellar biogenesis protein FliO